MAKKRKSTSKSKDVFKTLSDEFGNLLLVANNGKRILLTLHLVGHTKKRKIGTINLNQKVFEVKRKRALHLFRKNQSYGFNYRILEESKLFDDIRLKDEHSEWLVPKRYILENGSFLHFKNNGGYERQIFIELDKIQQFERPAKI